MYVVVVRLIRGQREVPAGQLEAAWWRRAVLSAAEPGDRLEHVFAEAGPQGADIALWLSAAGLDRAEERARRLARRLLARPELTDAVLAGCRAELLDLVAEALFRHEV